VQQAAAAAVERRLMSTYAGHFFASASLGDHLLELRRNKLDGLHERVQSLLRSPSARAAREAALDSDDRQVRRAAFRLSADCGGDVRGLLLRALCCDDLWVRLWAVRLARARLYGPALREVLAQARGDRSVPVRREALLGLKDDPLELLQSLFDPSRGVRDMVCFYLRNKTHLDLASLYRQEVTRLAALGAQPRAGAQLATALYGLSETGSAADADSLELHTIDDRPRVRKAALLGLGRLDSERGQATLAAALADPHPGVCRAAVQALGRRMLLVGESALWRAFQEQRSPQCRLYLIGALASLPRWTSVRCLLRASGDPDPAVAAETQARLARWTAAVNTTRPTSEELATVHALSTRASLGRPLLQDLLSVLQPWNSSARP
jgi:HEAT repeat protein